MGLTRPPRAITIDDVADKAGVSAKTVSRVLNNEPNVRPAKRELVMKAARDLGYRPNPAARSLAGSRSFLIAHLHDNPVPEYITAVNSGIYDACRAKGYFLLPEPVDRSAPDFLDRLQSFLMTSRADGVVLTPPLCDDTDILALLKDSGTAYASLSPARQPEKTPVMRLDDRLAAIEIVKHLVEYGHKRIAFIAGPVGHNASTGRREGYLDAMAEAGLKVSPDLIAEGDYSLRSGLEAARKLISGDKRPTAIFAANDDMAVGAMTALMAEGLQIPRDISVAGYDDTRLASAVWPPLTTIRQPVEDMARRAAERLMTPDENAPLEEVFDFEIIVRQSTGPAAT
ncbi:MAG: LacI family DNA-binding transcriptional regulator [Henriciella sp.]|jgi:LacI family transcriptional regulator